MNILLGCSEEEGNLILAWMYSWYSTDIIQIWYYVIMHVAIYGDGKIFYGKNASTNSLNIVLEKVLLLQ